MKKRWLGNKSCEGKEVVGRVGMRGLEMVGLYLNNSASFLHGTHP